MVLYHVVWVVPEQVVAAVRVDFLCRSATSPLVCILPSYAFLSEDSGTMRRLAAWSCCGSGGVFDGRGVKSHRKAGEVAWKPKCNLQDYSEYYILGIYHALRVIGRQIDHSGIQCKSFLSNKRIRT